MAKYRDDPQWTGKEPEFEKYIVLKHIANELAESR